MVHFCQIFEHNTIEKVGILPLRMGYLIRTFVNWKKDANRTSEISRGVYSSREPIQEYMCHNWYNLIDFVWINWLVHRHFFCIGIKIIRLTIIGPSKQTAPQVLNAW